MRGRSAPPGDITKHLTDVIGAAVALVVLLPLLLLISIAILADLGPPVLFRQERIGQYGVPFLLVKFRTMRVVDPGSFLVSDGDRLTPLGRLLRRTSLDELPSLWNVLRGEMSLVGPRPLLTRYLDRFNQEQARRHVVRPGITGLAQVSGRNQLNWEEKFRLDTYYAEHRCAATDLQILLRTVPAVLTGRGVSPKGLPTAPEFLGAPTRTDHGISPECADSGAARFAMPFAAPILGSQSLDSPLDETT